MNSPSNFKKIIIVISSSNFRDEEYFIPKDIFIKNGFKVRTASNKLGMAIGVNGGDTLVDILVSEVNVDNFDAIIFIGGPGALKNLDNDDSYTLIKKAIKDNMILGSICISPVILARAGVLRGIKATVWSSQMDKTAIKIIKENGAIYIDEPVVIDQQIITADGPSSAQLFAQTIIDKLSTN
jgi:protease I